MAQITINIQTLDWTMGETVGLHLMLKKGSKARIAWGDGKVVLVTHPSVGYSWDYWYKVIQRFLS